MRRLSSMLDFSLGLVVVIACSAAGGQFGASALPSGGGYPASGQNRTDENRTDAGKVAAVAHRPIDTAESDLLADRCTRRDVQIVVVSTTADTQSAPAATTNALDNKVDVTGSRSFVVLGTLSVCAVEVPDPPAPPLVL